MDTDIVNIGRKMDALGLWDVIAPYNWAIKPRGVAFPYFCTFMGDTNKQIKGHFIMLEGWQTFHDYVRTRIDNSFGFYSTPSELPHYEICILADGSVRAFRCDAGYVPRNLANAEESLCARILWEAYGIMMRIESDRSLPLKFAADSAIFARVEGADGSWRDDPLQIPMPRPHVEKVAFRKVDIASAKDLPFAAEEAIAVDFRLLPGVHTAEPRPRSAYLLGGIDDKTGERIIYRRMSISPEGGLRGLWESVAPRLLKELLARGRIPGEVKVISGRLFRMVRPLCTELPFKLSLHDSIPALDEVMK